MVIHSSELEVKVITLKVDFDSFSQAICAVLRIIQRHVAQKNSQLIIIYYNW